MQRPSPRTVARPAARPVLLAAILGAALLAPAWSSVGSPERRGRAAASGPDDDAEARHEAAVATISEDEIGAHVRYLASPRLEGRNTPSAGLELAAEYIAGVFAEAGLQAAGDSLERWQERSAGEAPEWSRPADSEGTWLRPWVYQPQPRSSRRRGSPFQRPVPSDCALELEVEGQDGATFTYGEDFVPLRGCAGDVRGELVFVGFGISSKSHKYDDLRGKRVEGKIALVFVGEPRHRRKFDGEEVTAEASFWNKLDKLGQAGVLGVIFVRRAPPKAKGQKEPPPAPPLAYRYSRATWNPPSTDRRRGSGPPAIEVSMDCAQRLTGKDVVAVAAKMDRSARPTKLALKGRTVSFRATLEEGSITVRNVVGVLPGSDPSLADEYVLVGAHYDHIGVGPRGRIGFGADDNASGTSALLEIVGAMAAARPRRSVLFCAFSGEEKGLLGSAAIAAQPPVPTQQIVAMVNLDMVGRGETREVLLMGFEQNPDMEKVVRRASRLSRTGIRKLIEKNDVGLFQRSDHYSFHKVGIPVVFFLEGPLAANRDYHSFRDTADKLDMEKVANIARLAFNTAWLLANDDERLPPPER